MTGARLLPDDRLQAAIDIVGDCPDAAFLVARGGTIVAWNRAASELFGIPAWDASARNCAAVVQGCSPAGEPVCRAGCPLLTDVARAPRSVAMRVRCGGLGAGRTVSVHHLPVRDARLGTTIAVLHLVDAAPGTPAGRGQSRDLRSSRPGTVGH
jgi:PAS domain-containing protein